MEAKKRKVVPFPRKEEGGFKGQFLNLKLSDLIQMSAQGKMSTTLRVTDGEKEGRIYIHEGNIIHAVCGKKIGKEAFYDILGWTEGSFEAASYKPPTIRSINLPWEHLLIEAHKRIDEKREGFPQSSDPLSFVPTRPEDPDTTRLSRVIEEWVDKHQDVKGACLFSDEGRCLGFLFVEKGCREDVYGTYLAIFKSAEMLGELLLKGLCQEVTLEGPKGSVVIHRLTDLYYVAVQFGVEVTKKAIYLMELEALYNKLVSVLR